MKLVEYPKMTKWPDLVSRPKPDNPFIEKLVRRILRNIKRDGDKAVRKYNKLFQKQNKEIITRIDDQLKTAIKQAKKNIETFHCSQLSEITKIETVAGVLCWQESRPIEKIGLYIPGGTAPLFSTILMLAVPATIAGCKEIILCCPSLHPAIDYTAKLCGITKIFNTGGAQAIAAMAYGTETIPAVDKIFGPGNHYVTLAKQLVQLDGIAIDMPAGPSELLIIADEIAVPEYVAADLLSQAEHGEDSQVILVSTSQSLIRSVKIFLKDQLSRLPRNSIAKKSLRNGSFILLKNIHEAIEFSNLYAPEHLILSCSDQEKYLPDITSAGSVFIGNYSPESAGDYASGTNHVLPTGGGASNYSGITLDSFQKKISFQQISKQGLTNISTAVMTMAVAEGLEGHKKAIEIRL